MKTKSQQAVLDRHRGLVSSVSISRVGRWDYLEVMTNIESLEFREDELRSSFN
jgi:hypothetical protein